VIINPQVVVEKGWIRNYIEECIQPNSIDVRLDRLFRIDVAEESFKGLVLGRDTRELPAYIEEFPDEKGFFYIKPFVPYQFLACEFVSLPEGVAARLHVRSTLNRAGVFISAGWWDSGFKNYVGASFCSFAPAKIERGARIAQIVFIEAGCVKLYDGIYNVK